MIISTYKATCMASYRQMARAQERREQIAALYVRGQYQTEIARQLHVTQQQVSLDLKIIRAQWRASAIRDFDAAKELELQKLDALEREAWQAWERSKQPREITLTEQTEGAEVVLPDGETRPRAAIRKASVRRDATAGDPRYLEQIQKCIAQRCALLGLTMTIESTTTVSTGLAALLEVARTTVAPMPAILPATMPEA